MVAFVTSKLLFSTERQHTMQDLTLFNKDSAKAITQDIKVFNCELGSIRVIVDNGEPLFCLADLAYSLELTNPAMVKEAINVEFDKGGKFNLYPLQTKGGAQNFTFINESELYFVIMRSRSDKAKAFRQWVTKEVLPSIRKNGGYIAGQESMSELEIIANALVVANNVIQQKSKELEAIKALRAKEKPLVDFANQVASASNSISVGEFAKLLNDEQIKIGQNNLFKWLRNNGYLMKDNMPYQKYIDSGYFDVIEQTYKTPYGSKVSLKTLVTGKGQIYFTEKLRNKY